MPIYVVDGGLIVNKLDRATVKIVFYCVERIHGKKQMSFLIKRIIDSMHKQNRRIKKNTFRKIKKYDEFCRFVDKLSDSDMKGKNCLIESLTIFVICKMKHIYVDFHIGIQKGDKFGSHAWTELIDRKDKTYLRRVYDIII